MSTTAVTFPWGHSIANDLIHWLMHAMQCHSMHREQNTRHSMGSKFWPNCRIRKPSAIEPNDTLFLLLQNVCTQSYHEDEKSFEIIFHTFALNNHITKMAHPFQQWRSIYNWGSVLERQSEWFHKWEQCCGDGHTAARRSNFLHECQSVHVLLFTGGINAHEL